MKFRPLSSVVIDSSTLKIYRGDRCVRVPESEFEIFHLLWKRGGLPVEHWRIERWLYGLRPQCDVPKSNNTKVLIYRLRQAVYPLGLLINSLWGHGYQLAVDHEESRMAA